MGAQYYNSSDRLGISSEDSASTQWAGLAPCRHLENRSVVVNQLSEDLAFILTRFCTRNAARSTPRCLIYGDCAGRSGSRGGGARYPCRTIYIVQQPGLLSRLACQRLG